MYLEIISPEAVLFSSNVDSVIVPGVDGEFQMLDNHAAVVSDLTEGVVKVHVHSQEDLQLNDSLGVLKSHKDDDKVLVLKIKSGTVEVKNNKVIVLAD